jgi:hypothetical protein
MRKLSCWTPSNLLQPLSYAEEAIRKLHMFYKRFEIIANHLDNSNVEPVPQQGKAKSVQAIWI